MSWEDQGRQFHQWFGHGTAGGSGTAAPVDAAGVIGAGAVAALGPVRGAALSRVLAEGGAEDLATALPIWTGSAGLAPGQFRALLVGKGLGAGAAASLQAMARASRDGDVEAAGRHLAAALAGEREGRWRYGLNYARDKAVYAAVNDLVQAATQQGSNVHTISGDDVPPNAIGPLRRLQGVPQEGEARGGVLKGGPRGGRSPRTGAVTPQEATALLPEGMSPPDFGRLAGLGRAASVEAGMAAEITPAETAAAVARLKAAGVSREAISAFQQFYAGVGNNGSAALRVRQLLAILGVY